MEQILLFGVETRTQFTKYLTRQNSWLKTSTVNYECIMLFQVIITNNITEK